MIKLSVNYGTSGPYIHAEQLESLQHYDSLWPKEESILDGIVEKCSYCLMEYLDGEDGCCAQCRESFKLLDE